MFGQGSFPVEGLYSNNTGRWQTKQNPSHSEWGLSASFARDDLHCISVVVLLSTCFMI